MLNNNIIKVVGVCTVGVAVGYAGTKIVCKTAKKINEVVKTNKIKRGRLVKIDGEYCKAEWV